MGINWWLKVGNSYYFVAATLFQISSSNVVRFTVDSAGMPLETDCSMLLWFIFTGSLIPLFIIVSVVSASAEISWACVCVIRRELAHMTSVTLHFHSEVGELTLSWYGQNKPLWDKRSVEVWKIPPLMQKQRVPTVINNLANVCFVRLEIKGTVYPKIQICHHSLTLMLLQT